MGISPSNKSFIHPDFLLETEAAKRLYHEFAKDLPILDYHNHLSPKAISENTIFNSMTQLWLEGDHYKWRALRTLGVDEKYITGTATDQEKFVHYASAVPFMIRNPLYHCSVPYPMLNRYEVFLQHPAPCWQDDTSRLKCSHL